MFAALLRAWLGRFRSGLLANLTDRRSGELRAFLPGISLGLATAGLVGLVGRGGTGPAVRARGGTLSARVVARRPPFGRAASSTLSASPSGVRSTAKALP
jgi:hypothetical protein